MSTAGTALTFSIGAIIGAGWVNAFSKATKESETFAGKVFKTFTAARRGKGVEKKPANLQEKGLADFLRQKWWSQSGSN